MPMLLCKLDELPPLFRAFSAHQNRAGPILVLLSRPKTAAGSRKAAAAVSCVVMPMLLCKLDELPPLLVRFFAHQTRAGPTGDPASRPRSTAGPKRAAAAVSCTVMLRLFCELGVCSLLFERSLLTKMEQALSLIQLLSPEPPLSREKQRQP